MNVPADRFTAGRSIPRAAIVPAAVVLVWSYAIWAVSPRFALTRPALVDDWYGITYSRSALTRLLHFRYGSGGIDTPGRYRPAYTAFWDFLQWHTFDAPLHMVGPNAWNLVRIGLFIAAIVCVASAVQDRSVGRVRAGVVAAAAGLLVISTPATAVDLARFGTGEPLMLGGLLGGGLLVLAAVRRTLARHAGELGSSRATTAAMFVAGYALYLLGAYMKEASICLLVLLPFVYLHLEQKWREESVIRSPLWRIRSVQIAAVFLVAPLLHVGGHVVSGSARYQRHGGTWSESLLSIVPSPWILGTPVWSILLVVLPVAVAVVVATRRSVPWLALGLVVAGSVFVGFQTATGDRPSRYYLPGIVFSAVALAHLISQNGRRVQVVFVAVAVLVAATSQGRATVSRWAVVGRAENAAVEQAARLDPARCRVYYRNFDLERRVGLTKLVPLVRADYTTKCRAGAGVSIYWRAGPRTPTAGCARPGWIKLRDADGLATFGCRRLAA
jgi:hypothetical protein